MVTRMAIMTHWKLSMAKEVQAGAMYKGVLLTVFAQIHLAISLSE